MRNFVCGFMDCEAKFIQSNAVCNAATAAVRAHDAFVDTGKVSDLDAFMDALVAWREAPTYPFPPYFSRSH
jgi:hypothetical protein